MAKQLTLVVFLALLAVVAGVEARGSSRATGPAGTLVAFQDRICSLLSPSKTSAGIGGQDGGTSLSVGTTSFWTFGDAINTTGRTVVLPNAIATTSQTDASACLALTPKVNASNAAVPLLRPIVGQEMAVWPDGMVTPDNSNVYFYYMSVRRCAAPEPCAARGWTVRGIGLATFDSATMTATRIGDCTRINDCFLWHETDGSGVAIMGATAVSGNGDGYVYLYLNESTNGISQDAVRIARVPIGSIENKAAYQYLNTAGGYSWVAGLALSSRAIQFPGGFNGMSVAFNQYLSKWTAVYTTNGFNTVAMRLAATPYGPWNDSDTVLIDCKSLFPNDTGLRCYFGRQHSEFAANNGQTIYVTYSNEQSYQTYLHRIVFLNGDSDHDGFSDASETYLGTDPARACGPNAWPPDFNGDGRVTVSDILSLLQHYNSYDRRYDLNGSGKPSVADILLELRYFSRSCPGEGRPAP